MTKYIECLAIGSQFPLELPGEGPLLRFRPSGVDILYAMPNPSAFERRAFKSGHAMKLGIAKSDRLGALILDFGEGFSAEVPFDAGIEKPENIPDFSGATGFSRLPVVLVGIDTADEIGRAHV